MLRSGIAALVLQLGCTGSPTPLANFRPTFTFATVDAGASVRIELEDLGPDSGCAFIDESLRATVGDTAIPIEDAGEENSAHECTNPVLVLDHVPTALAPGGQLVLADSSMTYTLDLGDALIARTVASVDAWTFHSNQPAVIDWSPTGDLPRSTATVTSTIGGDTLQVGAVVGDGTLTIAPVEVGTGGLAFALHFRDPSSTRCPPNRPCTWIEDHGLAHAVTIVP